MLIASIVSSCLALFLHAGMCPEGDKPGMSTAQPEMRTFEHREDRLGFAPEGSGLTNVQFEFVLDDQPEDGPRGGRGGPGGPGGLGGPGGPGGFGGPEGRGGGPRDERAQGHQGPDVQRLMQRIQQLERQLAERQGRGERGMGGQRPPRDDNREAKRAHKRAGKQHGPQGGPFGGPRGGGMGPGGMGGGMGRGGGMLPPGGPGMFQRRGEMFDRMRGEIRERAGQRLAERGERMMERGGPRQDMAPQGGPGGQGGPRPEGGPRGQGPREEIRIEHRLGHDQGPGGMGGPNEHRITREGQEIRIEERREGNPGSQNATDPKLQRILNMVERINERLDRLEKQTSHGEPPMPQDRPGDAPRPRGPQDGGGRGER